MFDPADAAVRHVKLARLVAVAVLCGMTSGCIITGKPAKLGSGRLVTIVADAVNPDAAGPAVQLVGNVLDGALHVSGDTMLLAGGTVDAIGTDALAISAPDPVVVIGSAGTLADGAAGLTEQSVLTSYLPTAGTGPTIGANSPALAAMAPTLSAPVASASTSAGPAQITTAAAPVTTAGNGALATVNGISSGLLN